MIGHKAINKYAFCTCNCHMTIVDGEVQYGNERLELDSTHYMSCKTIAARDDYISDGTHTSMLTIGRTNWSSVPVMMSHGRIPITVLDVDGKYWHEGLISLVLCIIEGLRTSQSGLTMDCS